jgi:hypothetical protein
VLRARSNACSGVYVSRYGLKNREFGIGGRNPSSPVVLGSGRDGADVAGLGKTGVVERDEKPLDPTDVGESKCE